jgi:DNA polymerase I-like protein with 3'-5' exonuclease and polymerase domains
VEEADDHDAEALDAWIGVAFAARVVAFDTETSALDAIGADLVGVSLSIGAGRPATSRWAMAARICSPKSRTDRP